MVLMSDNPVTVYFLQANRQPEIQFDVFTAGFRSGTAHECGDEGNILPGGDRHLLDVENHRIVRPREKQVPGRSVRVDPLRLQRRWNVEHQHVRRVVTQNSVHSLRRTALAQFSTSWPISASSLALAIEPRHNVGLLIPTRLS